MNEPYDETDDQRSRDVDAITPTSLSHIVGQEAVVDRLRIAVDAAHADCTSLDSALLVGPPGLGKSTMARVVAHEMASNFHESLAQSLQDPSDFNRVLLKAKDKDIVHVDEAHELAPRLQTTLCRLIDKRTLAIDCGGKTVEIPVADFTLFLSTTDEHRLIQPLRDRIAQVLNFNFYSEADLICLLDCRCRSLKWTAEESVILGIAKRSRGIPRLGLRFVRSCHRLCRAEGQSGITFPMLHRVCQLEGIDELGLMSNEQAFLRLIGDGSTRVHVLASQLGLPVHTLIHVIEPFLFRAGLIVKDEGSRRQLTAAGHEHLAALCAGGV